MWYLRTFAGLVLLAAVAGCSSPEERAAAAAESASEAEEEVARRRLELVDKYQTCIEEAAGDAMKAEACESYLKAADALK